MRSCKHEVLSLNCQVNHLEGNKFICQVFRSNNFKIRCSGTIVPWPRSRSHSRFQLCQYPFRRRFEHFHIRHCSLKCRPWTSGVESTMDGFGPRNLSYQSKCRLLVPNAFASHMRLCLMDYTKIKLNIIYFNKIIYEFTLRNYS